MRWWRILRRQRGQQGRLRSTEPAANSAPKRNEAEVSEKDCSRDCSRDSFHQYNDMVEDISNSDVEEEEENNFTNPVALGGIGNVRQTRQDLTSRATQLKAQECAGSGWSSADNVASCHQDNIESDVGKWKPNRGSAETPGAEERSRSQANLTPAIDNCSNEGNMSGLPPVPH